MHPFVPSNNRTIFTNFFFQYRYIIDIVIQICQKNTFGAVFCNLPVNVVYFKFRGKWIVFFFVLVTLMMPTEVMILAMFRLVSGFGWQDTMASITVPFFASATGAFLFRQHFANMPVELLEASQIDGATPFKFLARVLVPLSWNIIAALFVIQFVYTWNMFLWPSLIIRDDSAQVVQVAMQTLLNFGGALTFGPLMLAAIIASIPPALVFVAMQKPFMSGFVISQDK